MKTNILMAAGLVLFGALMIATLRPVPEFNENNCVTEQGVVTAVYEAGPEDVVLKLDGKTLKYKLDDALDEDYTLEDIKQKVLNRWVVIKYPKERVPLNTRMKQVSKIEIQGKVVYSMIEE